MRRLIAAFLLLLAGPAAPALAQSDFLAGTQWVLAGEAGRHAPALRFDAGRVAGSGGCNRFNGRYELAGDALTLSPLAATRMACPAEIMKKEQAFFAMLAEVRRAELGDGGLELKDAGGQVLARLVLKPAD